MLLAERDPATSLEVFTMVLPSVLSFNQIDFAKVILDMNPQTLSNLVSEKPLFWEKSTL